MAGKRAKARAAPAAAAEPVPDTEPSDSGAAVSGKKSKGRGKGGAASWLLASDGWKGVDVGDVFLLGAEEGGFAGLEVLENCTLFDGDLAGAEVMSLDDEPGKANSKKQKEKQKKRSPATLDAPGGPEAAAPSTSSKRHKGADKTNGVDGNGGASGGVENLAALKAQLAALAKENQALKAAAGVVQDDVKGDGDAGSAGVVPGGETGAAKRKRKLEVYKAKMAALRQLKREKQKLKKKQQKQDDVKAAAATVGGSESAEDEGDGAQGEGDQEGEEGVVVQDGKKIQKQQKKQKQQREVAGQKHAGQPAAATADDDGDNDDDDDFGIDDDVPKVDVSAWKMFALHPRVEKALAIQGFSSPTEIQSAVLPAVLRDRKDVIGAAQTGSGKTLAFGLPIMQALLQEQEIASAEGITPPHQGKLRALIMAPTRELALQVQAHLAVIGKVTGVRVAAIVGGLAHVKQERVLRSHPAIVVATPGRLWELLRDQTSPHLSDMSGLRFLVLDEADRMVAKGHFQELSSILALVPRPGGGQTSTFDDDFHATLKAANELEKKQKGKRTNGKKGRDAGEQDKVQEEEEQEEGKEDPEEGQEEGQEEGESGEGERDLPAGGDGTNEKDEGSEVKSKVSSKVKRGGTGGSALQTLVFSATLTLPSELRKRLRKGGGGALGGTDLDSLMDRVPFHGSPRIVDLSNKRKLASGVTECMVQCLSGTDRDAVLYYLLARHPGRVLVFVNAVSALRRVAALLKLLGLRAHALHAQQQQRQRLKALDSFKSNEQAVLVATDVAARGLDVRDVRMVIHYQLPATVDTYIHRSGRTARGNDAEGLSVALVAPDEAMRWQAVVRALGQDKQPPAFPVDATLMPQVVARLKLALRIDEEERSTRKASAEEGWERKLEAEVGFGEGEGEGDLDGEEGGKGRNGKGKKQRKGKSGVHRVDDDEDDLALTNKRAQARKAAELASLKRQLASMLSQPLMPHMSRSYFTGGAAAGVALSSAAARGGRGAAAAAPAPGGKDGKGTVTAGVQAAATATAQAVANANRLHVPASGKNLGVGSGAGVGKKKGQKRLSVQQLAMQELARRKAVKQAKRKGSGASAVVGGGAGGGGGRKGGLVVIPPAVSRDLQGPDGLEALKRKIRAVSA